MRPLLRKAFFMALVGLGALSVLTSWLGIVAHRAYQQRVAVSKLRALGGIVVYDFQLPEWSRETVPWEMRFERARPVVYDKFHQAGEPAGLSLIQRILGTDFLTEVIAINLARNNSQTNDDFAKHVQDLRSLRLLIIRDTQATDAAMVVIGQLDDLEGLYLFGNPRITDFGMNYIGRLKSLRHLEIHTMDIPARVTDDGLGKLKELTSLEGLVAQSHQFTDEGLEHLKGLKNLKRLILDNPPPGFENGISDEGLIHLQGLTNLEELWLQDTQVTDRGLEYLKPLLKLKKLLVGKTRVTREGAMKLEQALPQVIILF